MTHPDIPHKMSNTTKHILLPLLGAAMIAHIFAPASASAAGIPGWEPEGATGGFAAVKDGSVKFFSETPTDGPRTLVRTIEVVPGGQYALSARVRSENLKGTAGVPAVMIEWLHKGIPVDRATLKGPEGTTEWKAWDFGTHYAPVIADSVRLKLHAPKGSSGGIWWEEVKIGPVKPALFDPVLAEPHYRGWMYGDYPSALKVVATVHAAAHGAEPADLALDLRLTDAAGKELAKTAGKPVREGDNVISLPRPDLAPGNYTVEATLRDTRAGKSLGSRTFAVTRLAGAVPGVKNWIDGHGRLIVDGQPFFPLGLYTYRQDTEQDLKKIADAGFNAVMPYESFHMTFDRQKGLIRYGDSLGVKTLYSLKDFFTHQQAPYGGGLPRVKEYIEALKGEPGIITWYLADEVGPDQVADLESFHQAVLTLDPGRPTWKVDFRPEKWKLFENGFDIFGLDWYPVSWLPIDTAGSAAVDTARLLRGSRTFWGVPQIHNLKFYNPAATSERPPTLSEMRNMAYQYLAAGATGLVFYSYYDVHNDPDATPEERWALVSKMAAELKPMLPILLSTETPAETAVTGEGLMHFSRKHEGKTYLYVINTSSMEHRVAAVTLPDAANVTVNGEARTPDENRQVGIPLRPLDIAKVEIGR